MKAKTKRLLVVVISGICLLSAVGIMFTVFRDNLVFFYDPTQLQTIKISPDKRIRVGGLVKEQSIKSYEDDKTDFADKKIQVTEFELTDLNNSVQVKFSGLLPPLFREGQGIVAEGKFRDNIFIAENLLTKHDEKYMPPEIADSLKKSGQWKGEQ